MKIRLKLWFAAACACLFAQGQATIPSGYYDSCEGKSGQALLKALSEKIANHTNVGYDGLWEVYRQSDVHPDGSLWDIYTTKHWGSNFKKCGNYSLIGDCVNREHSLPKSWWGGSKSTQYSDAFHLYPTDGKVNGQRSNYPFGECSNGTRLPNNGSVQALGKLGNSTFSGFSGRVFEPDDEYKGDLARSYFYMAACYNSIISGWTSGNGSDFFAGNSYPVFKSWAINLLLKWTRQDIVSQKELDRNDAIYQFQHNRNPFIDHPELAEHIWGNKQNEPWSANPVKEPAISLPVNGSEINIGYAATGIARTQAITVKGTNLDETVRLSASGAFTVNPTSLSATQVNNGTTVNLTVLGTEEGTAEGLLTISSGNAVSTVDLTAEVVDGLPVTITNVTSNGFNVNWINLDTPATDYTVHIKQGNSYVPGYPVKVLSSKETHLAYTLDPLTKYTIQVTTPTISSSERTITTADVVPSILLLFDGDLDFFAEPGTPSEAAEILMDVENVSSDITVSVDAPFELSCDKSAWTQSITLDPEEDRFYLRINSASAGEYSTFITCTANSYTNDDAEATATIAEAVNFLEDWEQMDNPSKTVPCYSTKTFQGSVCQWTVTDGGFGSKGELTSSWALRMGKSATSTIAMAEDKLGGIGIITFEAGKWDTSEATATIEVEYSTNQGSTWTSITAINIDNVDPEIISVPVNYSGTGRIRLRQTSGKRWLVDNIGISNYSGTGAVMELEYHTWDSFCRNGKLVIESRENELPVAVYGMDGLTWVSETITAGTHEYSLPKGLYVVAGRDFTRRVVIK
ncbi:MAG: endonuclease [Paramuribaculum sp.]|nr:endonuclease [Paramuribaculum sp.]